MSLVELRTKLEETHAALVAHYGALREVINASRDSETVSVRDEVWRAAQHVLRTALIAENAAQHVETKRRRMELENSFYLPDPYEVDPFAPEAQNTIELPAVASADGGPGASQSRLLAGAHQE